MMAIFSTIHHSSRIFFVYIAIRLFFLLVKLLTTKSTFLLFFFLVFVLLYYFVLRFIIEFECLGTLQYCFVVLTLCYLPLSNKFDLWLHDDSINCHHTIGLHIQ